MDETTRRLADFAMAAEYDALPASAIHECKRRLIDTFACAVGAYHEPLSEQARAMAKRQLGTPSASVLGCEWRTSMEMAAFANGVMLRYLDTSDMYRVKSGGHPSDVIAAVLAVADAVEADGRAVINAVTLAYEFYCSFCESVEVKAKGWDQPLFGVMASAAGAGKLLGLDHAQMGEAIALALTPNLALNQTRRGELSSWKNCAGANAARNGVFAALLAQDGFTGPDSVFEGHDGLWKIIGKFDWKISPEPGESRAVGKTHLKSFPACYHGQTAIWAALDMRERVLGKQIEAIELETYRIAVDGMANDPTRWAPATHSTADHSLPYVIAVALTDGELTTESFADERLKDPALARLMAKTAVREAADLTAQYPEAAPCRLTIRTADGGVHAGSVTYPKGHNKNPFSDVDVEQKFAEMFRGFGSESDGRRIVQALWDFDQVRNVRDVLSLFVEVGSEQVKSQSIEAVS